MRIELLTHDARRVLRAGDRVTGTLRGSLGGSATFHIFGVVTDLGMREIRTGVYQAQPALYTGTYIVRPGDVTRHGALMATLTVGGQTVTALAERPITIDTRGPVVTSRQPKPGATVTNIRPNIVVQFFDGVSSVNPGAVRILVNGRNVTAQASISETAAAYNPEAPFAPGPVRVQVTVTDRARNAEQTEWTFTVAATDALIKSVTINPSTPLTPGDILTVVANGVPGGKASFTIQGILGAVAMRESRTAGTYFGTFPVPPGASTFEAPLLVTLEKDGRRSTVAAAVGVTIVAAVPPAPTILSPERAIVLGEEPVTRVIIRGRSRAGFRILGRMTYTARTPSGEEQGSLGEFMTIAAADGSWQVAFGPLVAPAGARVAATVIAIDPAGQRSPPAVKEVAQSAP